jgi:hypothetical protein
MKVEITDGTIVLYPTSTEFPKVRAWVRKNKVTDGGTVPFSKFVKLFIMCPHKEATHEPK